MEVWICGCRLGGPGVLAGVEPLVPVAVDEGGQAGREDETDDAQCPYKVKFEGTDLLN